MLTEQGRVVAVDRDGLWVETRKHSACAKCSGRHACGQKLLADVALNSDMTIVKAVLDGRSSKAHWEVGEYAMIGVQERVLLAGAFIAYGIPIALMLLGAICGAYVTGAYSEALSAVGGLLGLLGGGLFARLMSVSRTHKSYFQAFVLGESAQASILRTSIE